MQLQNPRKAGICWWELTCVDCPGHRKPSEPANEEAVLRELSNNISNLKTDFHEQNSNNKTMQKKDFKINMTKIVIHS